ncbi:MAG TPA: SpoIIE family protein phosphatase [Gaiellaceae bacterium]|jgi:serine phosphatase RsbU (regulator of sigma subunit)/PAS domain-containing protein|nr:SpoIIE family protein phosphatase [Gaiellaceae bacterium]
MTATTTQLESLAAAAHELTDAENLDDALVALARAVAAATGATLAVVRVPDRSGGLPARGVWSASAALCAELEGSCLLLDDLAGEEQSERDGLPAPTRRLAERSGFGGVLMVPALTDDRVLASLELMRPGEPFSAVERMLAQIAVHEAGLLVRAFELPNGSVNGEKGLSAALELAGRALTAGTEEARSAERIARLAAEVTHADSCVVWRTEDGAAKPIAAVGVVGGIDQLARAAERELAGRSVVLGVSEAGPVALVRLGDPPLGGLRLVFGGSQPSEDELERLAAFGARAAHALRAGERSAMLSQELERSRALLAVVGQAIAELSLSHTLETAVDRVAELLGTQRAAVYLRTGQEVETAAERGLVGPHARVAQALLGLTLGHLRPRAVLEIPDAAGDPAFAVVRDAVSEAGIEAVVSVPLRAGNELIGLLAVYLPAGRRLHANESALLAALAGQLAVAVQNAGLHEETMRLARDREQALQSERRAARRLEAFFEISRSFSESLRLEETVAAVTRTAVELLEVDAAVLRLPDGRGEELIPRSVHIPDARLAAALEPILNRPQPVARLTGLGLGRARRALILDQVTAERLGGGHELLVPFLRRGSSAAVVPIVASGEVIASLTLVALDPAHTMDAETVETLRSLAAQAALAIDNARLYQQQAGFADAMQRSLLPATPPVLPGIEIGSVYESSAGLDVGGDVFDYATLPDGRLAVVIGDVTGKGIDAAADMAMTKFVFRSLAREHPEPGDFLHAANEVVVEEVQEAKFVTLVYVTLDPETGELACASAGHPNPRLVRSDGAVVELAASGLALGIAADQDYPEARGRLEERSAVVLFTDGVIEARRDGDLYGHERLDRFLSEHRELSAAELARALVDDAKAFSGGDLVDDSAVVVVKRP